MKEKYHNSYNSPVDKSFDIGNIGEISYEDVKIIVKGVVDKAKERGVEVDAEVIYNENTGQVSVTLERKN